jgi:hypothetical protein
MNSQQQRARTLPSKAKSSRPRLRKRWCSFNCLGSPTPNPGMHLCKAVLIFDGGLLNIMPENRPQINILGRHFVDFASLFL